MRHAFYLEVRSYLARVHIHCPHCGMTVAVILRLLLTCGIGGYAACRRRGCRARFMAHFTVEKDELFSLSGRPIWRYCVIWAMELNEGGAQQELTSSTAVTPITAKGGMPRGKDYFALGVEY